MENADDAFILANWQQALLTADKLSVAADGVDFAVVTVQLKSYPLNDDSVIDLQRAIPVVLDCGGEFFTVLTDANGDQAGVITVPSNSAAPFQKIWMPMQKSRKAESRMMTAVPVGPILRERPSA